MKTQASNADKILIDSVIVKLTLESKIINKKSPQGLDLFYNSTKEIDNIQYNHSQNQLQSTNLSDINSSFLSEATASIDTNLHLYAKVLLQTVQCLILKFHLKILLLKKTFPILTQKSTPQNLNPIVMICYTFRKLASLRLNLMLSKVLSLVKYLI